MGLKWVFVFIVIINLFFDILKEYLNLSSLKFDVHPVFKDSYPDKRYRRSQQYLKETTIFGLFETGFSALIIILFVIFGGFELINQYSIKMSSSVVVQGLIFAGIFMLFSSFVGLPWDAYKTFVIEEKYGFNKTNVKTFFGDWIKSIFLMLILGGVIWSIIIFIFQTYSQSAWILAWGVVVSFQLILSFLAPAFIMPLFNKFKPLDEGNLYKRIREYLKKVNFSISGVYIMDGSKRSAKTNAFFVGFGKYKRIALFDTLLEKHTEDEILAILAHEVGHYKKGHIIKLTVFTIMTTGLLLFIASKLIFSDQLYSMFNSNYKSVYAGLFYVGILWAFIDYLLSLPLNYISRKFEFEADEYSARTYGKPKTFINALKKLTADNLSNLNPHPIKILFDYSHPPVLERIKALKNYK